MVKQDTKVRFLVDSGILDHNAEVCVLSNEGGILFRGMAWEMDDDVLDMNLKHIVSVWTTRGEEGNGYVWIETMDPEPVFKPSLCVNYDEKKCGGCVRGKGCFVQRRKSSHGGFIHEESGIYYEGVSNE